VAIMLRSEYHKTCGLEKNLLVSYNGCQMFLQKKRSVGLPRWKDGLSS